MSDKKSTSPGFLSTLGCTNAVWFSYLRRYGFEWNYFPRVVFGSVVTLSLTPVRLYEKYKTRSLIESTQIHGSPVFILGHWRSGTTLIHNLLSVDTQFGYVSYMHGLFPHCFLRTRLLSRVIGSVLPAKRPMDNMSINSRSPQEEELALVAQCGHSLYNMWIAPSQSLACWRCYGLLAEPRIRKQWIKGYISLLKTATYSSGGKRLLLKNPANTARVSFLLSQFPDAKFIYIYRNPYRVFESTRKLYRTVIPFFQLEESSESMEEDIILKVYREMFEAYEAQRSSIPTSNLIEVKYEDFVEDKLQGMKDIYRQLDLGEFTAIESDIDCYLRSIERYQTNEFSHDEESIEKVNAVWANAFKRYGYPQHSASITEKTDV